MSTTPEPDYYRVLNVHHQADPEIIEAAYHAMRQKFHGASTAEREIEEAYAVLIDPEKRAAYDARRRALLRQPAPGPEPTPNAALKTTPAPALTTRPAPGALDNTQEERSVPARCSQTRQGFDILLARRRGLGGRFRIVGFQPWPPGGEPPRSASRQTFLDRLFNFTPFRQKTPEPEEPTGDAGDNTQFVEFSDMDFGIHRCPICDQEAKTAQGMPVRWVLCGRCSQILCMGGAESGTEVLGVTCPWCGAWLRFSGAGRAGTTHKRLIKASGSKPSLPDPSPDKPALPPASRKSLPKG